MSFEQNYSAVDRLVHKLAFSSRAFQLTAADMDTTLFAAKFRHIPVNKPVFITSLPRAGTTLFLDMVQQSPLFATHCYRDMPFVYAPMLWRSLSAGFHKPAQLAERAHGDGMQVGYDSPEAFEEVLWRMFWPEKFGTEGIELWSAEEDPREFPEFFTDHIRKIIALKQTAPERARYISKNNGNIARIPFLRRLFPDAIVLVPLRDPVAQAVSLQQQHLRFLKVHAEEPFSKRYMGDIGHLEFGALHRPLMFPGMATVRDRYPADTLDYWIAYWIAAFEHVLTQQNQLRFFSYERACVDLGATLAVLRRELAVPEDEPMRAPTQSLHAPRRYRDGIQLQDATLLERAEDVYQRCLALSVI